jgi:hypothetical protein
MKVLVKLMGETALGLCDLAVVEPRPPGTWIPDNQPRPTVDLSGLLDDE